MSVTRRGFLGSILALAAAPAIVRADSLMKVIPRDVTVLGDYDVSARGSSGYVYDDAWRQDFEFYRGGNSFTGVVGDTAYLNGHPLAVRILNREALARELVALGIWNAAPLRV